MLVVRLSLGSCRTTGTRCRQFLVSKVVPVEKSNKKAGKYVINAYPCAIEIVWLMTVLAKTSRAAKAADNRPNKR